MPIFLIRHGSAGTRHDEDPQDFHRRLDAKGQAQAGRIATQLADRGITTIYSSPAERCHETVEPLARRLELSVQLTDSLAEGAGIEDAWALLESVLADTASAAMCSHGDVIPDLLRRAQLRGMVIPGKAGCAKGSVWTIDFVDGQPDVGTYSQP